MMDLSAAMDLVVKVAFEQDATVTVKDVTDLIRDWQSAKSGKLTMTNLTKDQAITVLQESMRTEALILQLIQDKSAGDTNFAEIKALASSVA